MGPMVSGVSNMARIGGGGQPNVSFNSQINTGTTSQTTRTGTAAPPPKPDTNTDKLENKPNDNRLYTGAGNETDGLNPDDNATINAMSKEDRAELYRLSREGGTDAEYAALSESTGLDGARLKDLVSKLRAESGIGDANDMTKAIEAQEELIKELQNYKEELEAALDKANGDGNQFGMGGKNQEAEVDFKDFETNDSGGINSETEKDTGRGGKAGQSEGPNGGQMHTADEIQAELNETNEQLVQAYEDLESMRAGTYVKPEETPPAETNAGNVNYANLEDEEKKS
jgi:hypothetical protein